MLGKLIRYDAKVQFRVLGGLSLICLIISLFTGIMGKVSEAFPNMVILDMFSKFSVALWVVAIIVLILGVFIYNVAFFRKNLFKDEGYLMHTIPVTETQLFISKLLTGTLAVAASVLVAFVSICIATMEVEGYITGLKELVAEAGVSGGGLFWGITILSILLSIPYYFCQFYASIAIGYTWKIKSGKHVNRDLLSVAVYAILYMIQQAAGMLLIFGYMFFVWLRPFGGDFEERMDIFMMSDTASMEAGLMDYLQGLLGGSLVITTLAGVVLAWLALRKMNRQLNLE